jgi:DNA-binding NtrC family response regulator
MQRILVIEDEPAIRQALGRLLAKNGFEVASSESVEEAVRDHAVDTFHLILTDLRLPGSPGTEIIPHAGGTPVLVMTSYASVRSAVDSMKRGAVDYIAKPLDHEELLITLHRILKEQALEKRSAQLQSEVDFSYPVDGMVGSCEAMRKVWDQIHKIAPTDATVLILGESGTGKELVARAIHRRSRRAAEPFVTVNCAAIPETLIESELFGHEKGAFTGADHARTGLVESADGGTLFLDEIGELPQSAQARLLRVLQNGEIRRIGSELSRRVSIRLVAATHRDLRQAADLGQFREDLYFRLRVLELNLPPLRERGEDIVELARFMLEKNRSSLNRAPLRFTGAALEAIRHYHWPGNVRELENAVQRAVILSDGDVIGADLLALDATPGKRAAAGVDTGKTSLDEYFRRFVVDNQGRMNETELARALGVSRKTLWQRRQKFGIPRP